MALMDISSLLLKNKELQNTLFPRPEQSFCEAFAWEKTIAVHPQ